MFGLLNKIFLFYYNWFKNLTSTSRKLWLLIFIKTTIVLTVLFLYFPDVLNQYETDEEKADAVAENLLR